MNNFFKSFLDDYFAECDEHLTAVRKNLLAIEAFVNQPQIERSLLDKLFSSFHSIKGLSGMVGLQEAEQIAHEMESYLRILRDKQVILKTEGIDALTNGTKMLEEVITAHRTQTPIPDIGSVISQLTAVFSSNSSPIKEEKPNESKPETQTTISSSPTSHLPLPTLNLKLEDKEKLAAELAKGARAWQFEFVPGVEKAARGINVNTVRDRLQSIGKLIHASPQMRENGGIAFRFILTSNADESSFVNWQEDGLNYAPYFPEEAEVQQSRGAEENIDFPLPTPDTPSSTENSNLKPQNLSPPRPTPYSPITNLVRVDLTRLDELMRMIGELVITRARLEDHLKNLKKILPASELRTLRETNQTLEHQLRDLREGIMRVRLVPIGEIFTRMEFVIRDLAKESQKQIKVEISGETTEIDKYLVERMMDPLLHLVRNAVSHALESESELLQAGKLKEGKISLRAFTVGEMVVIEVEDNGRGIDVEAVTKRAQEQGLISTDVTLDPLTMLDVICASGFSTRDQADKISGRGVGMAVVKDTVMELGGFLMLDTEVGRGTRFTIQLPLTLAIADALIVSVASQTFAMPLSCVREVLTITSTAIIDLENNQIIPYRDHILPLLRLSVIFDLERETGECRNRGDSALSTTSLPNQHIVVIGNGLNAVAIAVDRILGQQEIVVRPLSDPLVRVTGIAGATELGDGRIVLILDLPALTRIQKLKATNLIRDNRNGRWEGSSGEYRQPKEATLD